MKLCDEKSLKAFLFSVVSTRAFLHLLKPVLLRIDEETALLQAWRDPELGILAAQDLAHLRWYIEPALGIQTVSIIAAKDYHGRPPLGMGKY